jgi:transcriptional regulator with XRE-family HTH domain
MAVVENKQLAYDSAVAQHISDIRDGLGLSQAALARRMCALGFRWFPQTVGAIEQPPRKGGPRRNVTIAELLGLALALETTVAELLSAHKDDPVLLPSGDALSPAFVDGLVCGLSPRAVTWDGDQPDFSSTADDYDAFVRILAELLRAGRGRYEVWRQPDGSTAIVIRGKPEPLGPGAAVTLDRG